MATPELKAVPTMAPRRPQDPNMPSLTALFAATGIIVGMLLFFFAL